MRYFLATKGASPNPSKGGEFSPFGGIKRGLLKMRLLRFFYGVIDNLL